MRETSLDKSPVPITTPAVYVTALSANFPNLQRKKIDA